MKTTKFLGLMAVSALCVMCALAQTPPAPATAAPGQAATAAPANLSPGAAEVVRLATSGVGDEVVLAYIKNSQVPFDLSADDVLYLKDLGLSPEVSSAMLNHDNALRGEAQQYAPATTPAPAPAPTPAPPPPAAAPAPTVAAAPAPVYVTTPPPDVTYFYNNLAPYGTWVQIDGYGWCWQPTAVATTPGWRPYGDGGYWVYSDVGWYWQSTYSWGWAPFHYGRWYMHPRCGWVWTPDRVWGPAWVTWRTYGDYCGWAPLPPHAVFDVGLGWRYNGVAVGASFGFNLGSDAFLFVSFGDVYHHDLHRRYLPPARARTFYNQTTIINNYVVNNNHIENRGIPFDRASAATQNRIPRAAVRDWSDRPDRMPTRASSVVYRPRLEAPAQPVRMEAQKLDPQNPVIRHAPSAPVRTERVAGSGRGAAASRRTTLERPRVSPWTSSATPAASRPAQSSRSDRTPQSSNWSRDTKSAPAPQLQPTPAVPQTVAPSRSGKAPTSSDWSRNASATPSRPVQSAPSAPQATSPAPAARPSQRSTGAPDTRSAPAPQVRSAPTATQPVMTVPPAATIPRAPENWKQGTRSSPGYRSDSGLPALGNARAAEQSSSAATPSGNPHVYPSKTQRQAAELRPPSSSASSSSARPASREPGSNSRGGRDK